jgi:hypothetical protein
MEGLAAYRALDSALLAGTDFPQEPPGVNSEVMIVIPREADGVLAYAFRGMGLGRSFEHGQHAGSKFGGFARLAAGFVTLFVAHGTRTGVA